MFITFEGLDFSGKSTQAKMLHDWLKKHRIKSVLMREPGGTKISEKIRDILLDREHLEMTPLTEFLLFSSSRSQLVSQNIKPELKKGKIVICDRYYDSSSSYQGHGGKVDISRINNVNDFATGGLVPDLTFLIDISPKNAFARHAGRGNARDRMENKNLAFYTRVRKGFLKIAEQNRKRFVVVDGTRPIDEIHTIILQSIKRKLKI
jgi:dTMP kinase